MAIDPVELVNRTAFAGTRHDDLAAMLRRLADLPPSIGTPYVTVTADLRPDGSAPDRRTGVESLERELREVSARFDAHTPTRMCIEGDRERIMQSVRGADPAMLGFFAVACGDAGAFEAVAVPSPLPTQVATGPTPNLLSLARLVEEQPGSAVIAADGREAVVLVMSAASPDELISVQTNPYPRKQMQGGWSQQRYQNRADERLEAFARTLAGELRQLVESKAVEQVVVAADDPMRSTLLGELHPMVRERLAGELSLSLDLAPQALAERALPILRAAARKREDDLVAAVREGAGPGGRSVHGVEETLAAVQAGQVMTLVMNDDLSAPGWADFSLGVYGSGSAPAEHPAGGDPSVLQPIALDQELARLALQFDATIEIVMTAEAPLPDESPNTARRSGSARTAAARELDAMGGVGAILRFTLAPDRSTVEM